MLSAAYFLLRCKPAPHKQEPAHLLKGGTNTQGTASFRRAATPDWLPIGDFAADHRCAPSVWRGISASAAQTFRAFPCRSTDGRVFPGTRPRAALEHVRL